MIHADLIVFERGREFSDESAAVATFIANGKSLKKIRKAESLDKQEIEVWLIYEPTKYKAGHVKLKAWTESLGDGWKSMSEKTDP